VTQTPEQVRHAVELVVSDLMYRERVMEMKKEAENYDPLTTISRKSMRWQIESMQIKPSLEVL
jgi:hypothetical protein